MGPLNHLAISCGSDRTENILLVRPYLFDLVKFCLFIVSHIFDLLVKDTGPRIPNASELLEKWNGLLIQPRNSRLVRWHSNLRSHAADSRPSQTYGICLQIKLQTVDTSPLTDLDVDSWIDFLKIYKAA